MSVDLEKNIYGLSEGVFKACQFLGLKFPSEVSIDLSAAQELSPSDYFGVDFELNEAIKERLRLERKLPKEKFDAIYKDFSKKFASQKPLKHTKTDLNVYFCDYMLFSRKQDVSYNDYFDFEFYRKSFALRGKFITQRQRKQILMICNSRNFLKLTKNKFKANKVFADFLHRDWLDTCTCTFEEFKAFVGKHPRFFSKVFNGSLGRGAEIISINPNENLSNLFENLKSENRILEEIIKQHEDLAAFCPDTVNTIRVYTVLDLHNVVHILTTVGRFGRTGGVVDNFRGGGVSVVINPITGIITSDAINGVHQRMAEHPDTAKTFKGFQYPCWDKVRAVVKKMAKMIPQLRHIGWDITVTDKGEVTLIEINNKPGVSIQQAPDDTGRLHLYAPLLAEIIKHNAGQIKLLGYRVNDLANFDSAYNTPARRDFRLKLAMNKLIPDCKSLIDLGCRKSKLVKAITPPHVLKYYPVDFQKHDDEVIACDFNDGEFPDIKADTCLCAFTAEYIEPLPQFLANMCNAAQKQILMLCRPADKEFYPKYRWENPFLTDFTEEFLIKTMKQNNFNLNAQYSFSDNKSIFLYDFRR